MGRISDFLTGAGLLDGESRTITRGTETEAWTLPARTALPPITQQNALKLADLYACVRVLADGIASLTPSVYRRTARGRVPAGDDQRLVQLLRRPSPGATAADLFSTAMTHLCLDGNAFIAKYRGDGEIVQLGLLDPQSVVVEQRGERIVYRVSRREGLSEHGPQDILHVRGLSSDGLRGLSPVRAAAKVLGLNAGLVSYAANFLGNAARPGGILALSGYSPEGHPEYVKQSWQELFSAQGAAAGAGKIAVLSGDSVNFERVEPPMKDSEFLAQRELAAREVARAMRVPAWAIDAPTGDSLTYANAQQQARHLVDFSLRPWIVRLEQAISGDADLCPGSAYFVLDTGELLRADLEARAGYYERALNPQTGWLSRAEVREELDLPPEGGNQT